MAKLELMLKVSLFSCLVSFCCCCCLKGMEWVSQQSINRINASPGREVILSVELGEKIVES